MGGGFLDAPEREAGPVARAAGPVARAAGPVAGGGALPGRQSPLAGYGG